MAERCAYTGLTSHINRTGSNPGRLRPPAHTYFLWLPSKFLGHVHSSKEVYIYTYRLWYIHSLELPPAFLGSTTLRHVLGLFELTINTTVPLRRGYTQREAREYSTRRYELRNVRTFKALRSWSSQLRGTPAKCSKVPMLRELAVAR